MQDFERQISQKSCIFSSTRKVFCPQKPTTNENLSALCDLMEAVEEHRPALNYREDPWSYFLCTSFQRTYQNGKECTKKKERQKICFHCREEKLASFEKQVLIEELKCYVKITAQKPTSTTCKNSTITNSDFCKFRSIFPLAPQPGKADKKSQI